MRSTPATFLRLPGGLMGLLLVMLALAGQVAFGSLAPVDAVTDAQRSELAAAMGQCRTPDGEPGHDTRHRRLPDCAPAVSAELALPGFVAAPEPVLPVPVAAVAVRIASPVSARAPPSHLSHAGFPRGPPVLA